MSKVKQVSLAVALLFLCSEIAAACSCVAAPSVAKAFEDSKVVFSGEVIARVKDGVRFRVDKSWKGVSSGEVYIYTGNVRNSCDPWFEKGEQWLVYAWDTPLYADEKATVPIEVKLKAHGCHRTTRLESAADDLKQLGEGRPPVSKHRKIKRGRARTRHIRTR